MKHTIKVTYILTAIFFISQLVGLLIVNQYIDYKSLKETGKIEFNSLPGGIERPDASGSELIFIMGLSILIGTAILLVIIKFRGVRLWKIWYSFSVMFTLFFAFGAFFHALVASIASVVLTFFKVFRPNIFVHNFTEVFIYGGLAAIFVPIGGFTVFYAIIILVLISIYDMYAVWKSKHMVKLANFTAESKLFAGLNIPYEKNSGKIEKISARPLVKKGTSKGKEIKSAILGGGDIGFPLLFSGAVLKEIIVLNNSIPLIILKAFVVPVFTTIALYILFVKGEKNKFYPAMPFLTAGCLIGYGALVLINFWI